MYEQVHDIQLYLTGSIIRINRTPIYIRGTDDGRKAPVIHIVRLKDGKQDKISINDERLNFLPVPLGYVPTEEDPTYISRQPLRKWKQGLSNENIRILGGHERSRIGFPEFHKVLDATIRGKRKGYEEAIEEGGSFHREFFVMADILFYKGREIGSINKGDAILEPSYDYLSTYLEELK